MIRDEVAAVLGCAQSLEDNAPSMAPELRPGLLFAAAAMRLSATRQACQPPRSGSVEARILAIAAEVETLGVVMGSQVAKDLRQALGVQS